MSVLNWLTGYIAPFCSMKYVILLAYVHQTFKAEGKLQTFFCNLRQKLCS